MSPEDETANLSNFAEVISCENQEQAEAMSPADEEMQHIYKPAPGTGLGSSRVSGADAESPE